MTMPALEVRNLSKHFGAIRVTNDISISIDAGARHALIGPNGAGKTTLIHLITGVLKPNAGQIIISGHDVTHASLGQRVARGLARTFQINSLFSELTVAENVALGVAAKLKRDHWIHRGAQSDVEVIGRVFNLLMRLSLLNKAEVLVADLSYGQRRIVEVALALAMEPKILLLDEPAAGLSPEDSKMLLDLLVGLPQEVALVVIEHDMDLVFQFAKEITVLVEGRVLVTGPTDAVRNDPRVRDVYLGRRHG